LLDDHLLALFKEGKISVEDAIDNSHTPSEMQERTGAGAGVSIDESVG